MTASQDHIGIRYATVVLARGLWQGVVNVTLGAYNFDPDADNPKLIDKKPVIVDRIRMDIACARELHKCLGDVLAVFDRDNDSDPEPEDSSPQNVDPDDSGVAAAGKLN